MGPISDQYGVEQGGINCDLGTVQYSWQYGTGKLDTRPAVTFDLRAYGAVCFSEASVYGATAYF